MRRLALGLGLAIAGCSNQVTVPERISVAAAIACVDQEARLELEAACPRLRSDVEILALDDYQVIQAMRADLGKASICIAKLQAAVDACSRIPTP